MQTHEQSNANQTHRLKCTRTRDTLPSDMSPQVVSGSSVGSSSESLRSAPSPPAPPCGGKGARARPEWGIVRRKAHAAAHVHFPGTEPQHGFAPAWTATPMQEPDVESRDSKSRVGVLGRGRPRRWVVGTHFAPQRLALLHSLCDHGEHLQPGIACCSVFLVSEVERKRKSFELSLGRVESASRIPNVCCTPRT